MDAIHLLKKADFDRFVVNLKKRRQEFTEMNFEMKKTKSSIETFNFSSASFAGRITEKKILKMNRKTFKLQDGHNTLESLHN